MNGFYTLMNPPYFVCTGSQSCCPNKLIVKWYYIVHISHAALCSLRQARFWVQVMRGLREGVKLKKVQDRQYNPLPIEFQLTPYEMLMNDIKSKRYNLRKVMVSVQIRPQIEIAATCKHASSLLHFCCTTVPILWEIA